MTGASGRGGGRWDSPSPCAHWPLNAETFQVRHSAEGSNRASSIVVEWRWSSRIEPIRARASISPEVSSWSASSNVRAAGISRESVEDEELINSPLSLIDSIGLGVSLLTLQVRLTWGA